MQINEMSRRDMLRAAENRLEAARVRFSEATSDLTAGRELLEDGDITEEDLAGMKTKVDAAREAMTQASVVVEKRRKELDEWTLVERKEAERVDAERIRQLRLDRAAAVADWRGFVERTLTEATALDERLRWFDNELNRGRLYGKRLFVPSMWAAWRDFTWAAGHLLSQAQ